MIIGSEPPSSSVTRLVPCAASAATRCPTGVEPVKATLRTRGWLTSASPSSRPFPDDVEDAGRQARLGEELREAQRRERRRLGRLGHDGVAADAARARACCAAAWSGSSTARSPRPRRAGGAGRPPRRRRGRHFAPAHLPSPARRSARACGRLAQLELGLAQRLALLGHQQGASSSTCSSRASAPACRTRPRSASRAATRRRRPRARPDGAVDVVGAGARSPARPPRRWPGSRMVSVGCRSAAAAPSMNAPRSYIVLVGRSVILPTNSGARFSTKAVRPSMASLERNSSLDELALARKPSLERQLQAVVDARLIAAIAIGGPAASRRRRASSTRLRREDRARPGRARASSGVTAAGEQKLERRARGRCRRARRCVPPLPGSSPSVTSGVPSRYSPSAP